MSGPRVGARRARWWLYISVVLIAYATFWPVQVPAVVPALRGSPAPGAHLEKSLAYVILAPVSDTMDEFTSLSVPQLIAAGVWLLIAYVVLRVVWRQYGRVSAGREAWYALRAFLLLALFVICTAVLPRPMAALRMDDPEWVVFDVHSHTNFSHDARATFSVAANRAWHHDAGFNVAFITDHRCFDGAAEGLRTNPRTAGEGTVLLSGIELPPDQRHLVLLEPPDVNVPDGLLETWCVRAMKGSAPATPPLFIQTIPEDLGWLSALVAGHVPGVAGIELIDGAPRGLAQADRDQANIVDQATRLDLAMLAGSNNHGWGRTAVAWNVMRVPGWRSMTPDSLGAVIRTRLLTDRKSAAVVISRNRGDTSPMLVPLRAVRMWRSLTTGERISWVGWWLVALALVVLFQRRPWSRRAA